MHLDDSTDTLSSAPLTLSIKYAIDNVARRMRDSTTTTRAESSQRSTPSPTPDPLPERPPAISSTSGLPHTKYSKQSASRKRALPRAHITL